MTKRSFPLESSPVPSLLFLYCFHVLSLSGAHMAVVKKQPFLMLPTHPICVLKVLLQQQWRFQ